MAKGSSYEREIAKKLGLWFTEGKRDDIFWRSNSSGARFTQRKKSGKDTANQAGDLTFSDSLGEILIKNWNIEIKTGYSGRSKVKDLDGKDKVIFNRWDTLDIVDSSQKEPVLLTIWKQCKRDAGLTNRIPVLIFRRNGRKSCIMFTVKYLNYLFGIFGVYKTTSIMIITSLESYVIFNLQDFFNWIPDIRGALK